MLRLVRAVSDRNCLTSGGEGQGPPSTVPGIFAKNCLWSDVMPCPAKMVRTVFKQVPGERLK